MRSSRPGSRFSFQVKAVTQFTKFKPSVGWERAQQALRSAAARLSAEGA